MVLHQHPHIGTNIDMNTTQKDKTEETQQNTSPQDTTQNNTGIKTNMTRHNTTWKNTAPHD